MLPPISPRPFLCRSPLLPGESLYSLLIRLAVLNHYSTSLLLGVCFFRPGKKSNFYYQLDIPKQPLKASTYTRLAAFTDIAPADLYAATPHRYGRVLAPLTRRPLKIRVPWNKPRAFYRPKGGFHEVRTVPCAQFCPLCLKEAAYHRLIWALNAVSVCCSHQCLLVGHCPICRKNLGVEAVVKGQCQYCKTLLMSLPVHSVQDDAFGLFAQRTMLAWIEEKLPPQDRWGLTLPQQPAPLLYHFVQILRHALLRALVSPPAPIVPNRRTRKSREAETVPEIQYELTRLAVQAVVNWPDNFVAFRRALRAGEFLANSPLKQWAIPTNPFASGWREPAWKWIGLEFVCKVPSSCSTPS
jgi:hypothetical protein